MEDEIQVRGGEFQVGALGNVDAVCCTLAI